MSLFCWVYDDVRKMTILVDMDSLFGVDVVSEAVSACNPDSVIREVKEVATP